MINGFDKKTIDWGKREHTRQKMLELIVILAHKSFLTEVFKMRTQNISRGRISLTTPFGRESTLQYRVRCQNHVH